MSELSFLLAIAGLVAGTLAVRLLVLKDQLNGLPPMPSEH
jgi:hypothetical protein